jgi:hypothetical protein
MVQSVAQRPLEPLILVRVQVHQPVFSHAHLRLFLIVDEGNFTREGTPVSKIKPKSNPRERFRRLMSFFLWPQQAS